MRHGDKIKNLGRKKAHRDALLSNLTSQLITHKRIVTTLAKAKALRVYAEPLITKAKDNTGCNYYWVYTFAHRFFTTIHPKQSSTSFAGK